MGHDPGRYGPVPFYPIIFLVVIPIIVDVVYHEFTRTQAPRERKSTRPFKVFQLKKNLFNLFEPNEPVFNVTTMKSIF